MTYGRQLFVVAQSYRRTEFAVGGPTSKVVAKISARTREEAIHIFCQRRAWRRS
jgi:hypothetical protein